MRLRFTERADKDYGDLPVNIRKAFAIVQIVLVHLIVSILFYGFLQIFLA